MDTSYGVSKLGDNRNNNSSSLSSFVSKSDDNFQVMEEVMAIERCNFEDIFDNSIDNLKQSFEQKDQTMFNVSDVVSLFSKLKQSLIRKLYKVDLGNFRNDDSKENLTKSVVDNTDLHNEKYEKTLQEHNYCLKEVCQNVVDQTISRKQHKEVCQNVVDQTISRKQHKEVCQNVVDQTISRKQHKEVCQNVVDQTISRKQHKEVCQNVVDQTISRIQHKEVCQNVVDQTISRIQHKEVCQNVVDQPISRKQHKEVCQNVVDQTISRIQHKEVCQNVVDQPISRKQHKEVCQNVVDQTISRIQHKEVCQNVVDQPISRIQHKEVCQNVVDQPISRIQHKEVCQNVVDQPISRIQHKEVCQNVVDQPISRIQHKEVCQNVVDQTISRIQHKDFFSRFKDIDDDDEEEKEEKLNFENVDSFKKPILEDCLNDFDIDHQIILKDNNNNSNNNDKSWNFSRNSKPPNSKISVKRCLKNYSSTKASTFQKNPKILKSNNHSSSSSSVDLPKPIIKIDNLSDEETDEFGKPYEKPSTTTTISSKEEKVDNFLFDEPKSSTTKKNRKVEQKKFDKLTRLNAERSERERRKRLEEKYRRYEQLFSEKQQDSDCVTSVILDFDQDTGKILVHVDPGFVRFLKPHQIEGVKFMFDNTIESVKRLRSNPSEDDDDEDNADNKGSGCILAHSMGLGKTFQVVTFLHTIMTNPSCRDRIRSILIIVPLNVAKNWINEFDRWFSECGINSVIPIYEINSAKTLKDRLERLKRWHHDGGIMIFTINLFASLIVREGGALANRIQQQLLGRYLLDPGPDMVIIDEGHLLKNDCSMFNHAAQQIRSRRRIILTGTPLQNNLSEYFTMVDFVKPGLLGTKAEFRFRFQNPITNGQHIDSEDWEVIRMKRKVHVLHRLLKHCIHRCDYQILVPYLQPKYEYVLALKLTPLQTELYRYYLDNLAEISKISYLFLNYSILRLIWNHPALLADFFRRREEQEAKDAKANGIVPLPPPPPSRNDLSNDSAICLEDDDDPIESPPCGSDLWKLKQFLPENIYDLELSSKFKLMISILEHCERLGDKLLIFSQSLTNLDLIERFLRMKMNERTSSFDDNHHGRLSYQELRKQCGGVTNRWIPNLDYFRIDGRVRCEERTTIIETFNEIHNEEARLLLVSTRAGGIGVNLVGANRAIIFDVSWNPANDLQAIYRIFRYGQLKPVYVYRFTSFGTMENKIYDRQIIKQSLSHRVIDEQQIERHFTASELAELYTLTEPPGSEDQKLLNLPKDRLLADIILQHSDLIVSNHEHDSLLENKPEEDLSEQERLNAWQEYEREQLQQTTSVSLEQQQQQQQLALLDGSTTLLLANLLGIIPTTTEKNNIEEKDEIEILAPSENLLKL